MESMTFTCTVEDTVLPLSTSGCAVCIPHAKVDQSTAEFLEAVDPTNDRFRVLDSAC
eukprot:m.32384 g.32384  ORF g.32384 m.32384 type:complete len:57 (-) comp12146_c2_seq19:846-1016(-)